MRQASKRYGVPFSISLRLKEASEERDPDEFFHSSKKVELAKSLSPG